MAVTATHLRKEKKRKKEVFSKVRRNALVARLGPGIPQAERVNAFTVMTDVAPTLLEFAGTSGEAPDAVPDAVPMSGRSLRSLLTGDAERIYGPDEAIGFETSGQAALYRGDYKLVRNLPPHGDGVWRLYDLASDPGETQDLADAQPQLMREMLHEYRLYANRVGVLELPKGYDPVEEITRNVARKMLEYYWGWLLAGMVVLAIGLGGIVYVIRAGIRRVAPRH